MVEGLGAALVLSTPDTHILNDTISPLYSSRNEPLTDDDITIRYEIQRTVAEIRKHKWKRIALQFPDEMLPDSTRVFRMLSQGLKAPHLRQLEYEQGDQPKSLEDAQDIGKTVEPSTETPQPVKLTILADTSYGSCCVDEIAAEHVDADAVIHYGRACLSPTARIPVVHVFTKRELDIGEAGKCFQETFPDRTSKILLTGDVMYMEYVEALSALLAVEGYTNIYATSVIHEPASPVPNRTLPGTLNDDPEILKDWQLFHIAEPPTSLLLTLSSRVAAVYVYPVENSHSRSRSNALLASTTQLLRRRYALVTSLATVGIWGILINTLSVRNYLSMVDHVRQQITAAGKKSYLFVVGKLNAAKVANFSEVGGWVVIGCWESSLIDSKDFYKPVITPFELNLALKRDEDRLWTGAWRGDFQGVLDESESPAHDNKTSTRRDDADLGDNTAEEIAGDYDSEEESAPPEYDLRTGRYVSRARPLSNEARNMPHSTRLEQQAASQAVAVRSKSDVTAIKGVPSPAAEFLREKRTWQGLGSDFQVDYEEDERQDGAVIEEGRTGIARGYGVVNSDRT